MDFLFVCSFVFPFDYTKISSHSNSSCLVPEVGSWAFRVAAGSSDHLHAVSEGKLLFCSFEIKPHVRGPYGNSSPKEPWMHPENG